MQVGDRRVVREPARVWVGFPLVGGALGRMPARIADEAGVLRPEPARVVVEDERRRQYVRMVP